ncbi:pyridoxal-dependent decarboxylase [Desulfococcus sp.]|uniref:pyridoxal-dependent decarboxylase n=1 Tax=Desulfococcus sp. TaxID=2025834 RepID=UPI0035947976
MSAKKAELVANWETLQRIFIRPEDEASRRTLIKYMEQILFGLHEFLRQHVGITREASLEDLSERFKESLIADHPQKKLAEVIRGIIENIAPHAVNVASPYFIGHMTSAIPFFMVHLHTITAALNQNVVKIETSKVVSIIERQVLAKLHRLIFGKSEAFYDLHIQAPDSTLGGFLDDGTLANITAMWVARNRCFPAKDGFPGIEAEGVAAAHRAYGADRSVILVSGLAHYSLRKAGGVLGIGSGNVIPVPSAGNPRMDPARLEAAIRALRSAEPRTQILAAVAIAGATETGTIDPLAEIAEICARENIHFHVDAAWGGPTLLSPRYRGLLAGIERADSVTIDGHKQFYMPMGCGMVLFRDPGIMDTIAYHAAYINRPGSVDLGIRSLEGSRPASSLVLAGALEIMGAQGYALLIDHGIETARAFADEIGRRPLFELVTPPQLNILTYRIVPEEIQRKWTAAGPEERKNLARRLNDLNIAVQRIQREAGNSFVSRTTLRHLGEDVVVLRAVLMNPMTHMGILCDILDEQEQIYHGHPELAA